MPDSEEDRPALRLVELAITAKTASEVGWPHLATAAARECRRLAELVVIELSGACARTSLEAELADVDEHAVLPAALARLYGDAIDGSSDPGGP